eukprot:14543551-Alexandrium_andersonii.AAC.1
MHNLRRPHRHRSVRAHRPLTPKPSASFGQLLDVHAAAAQTRQSWATAVLGNAGTATEAVGRDRRCNDGRGTAQETAGSWLLRLSRDHR